MLVYGARALTENGYPGEIAGLALHAVKVLWERQYATESAAEFVVIPPQRLIFTDCYFYLR